MSIRENQDQGQYHKQNSHYLLKNEKKTNYSLRKVWALEKYTKLNTIFCLIKSSGIVFIILSAFDLIIWLMTSQKHFEKIAILKI